MSYMRQGERGLDNFYKPFHFVEYYRYVRFFPEGETGIILGMGSTNERRRYTVTPLLIGWAHTQNDTCER